MGEDFMRTRMQKLRPCVRQFTPNLFQSFIPRSPLRFVSTATESFEYQEGKARIRILEGEKVFYNPAMATNRDLSIGMAHVFAETNQCKIRILDALAASGIRTIRYATEIPKDYVEEIVANDFSEASIQKINETLSHNHLSLNSNRIQVNHQDANEYMYQSRQNQFDVVDLDPYGSPSPFLDSAIQALKSGGMINITATDLSVLCGKHPDTSFAKYGGTSLSGPSCHETAIRILLGCLATQASKYKRMIVPLVSFYVDYYIKIFAQIVESPVGCKVVGSKMGFVLQCSGCRSNEILPLMNSSTDERSAKPSTLASLHTNCQHCGSHKRIFGPMWIGPMNHRETLDRLCTHFQTNPSNYSTLPRLYGRLSVLKNELESPLMYSLPDMADCLNSNSSDERNI